MSKQLIISGKIFSNYQILNESSNSNNKFIVRGILQRADAKNQNGRVYPVDILKREAEKYAKTFIAEKRAFGELDHPDSSIVEGKNASHTVERLWWEGKDLYGDLEVLDTPTGRIVQTILKAGKTLGISSRGLGSVNQLDDDTLEVGDDFELIAWDFVTNPSTQGAFMSKVNESVSYTHNLHFLHKEIDKKINSILREL